MMTPEKIHIGISGWAYPQWKNAFYPPKLKDADRLPFYATKFNTVEINSSFYGLPREAYIRAWVSKTPDDFTFCFKMWRRVTHDKKLVDCENDIDDFLKAIVPAQEKTGPLLLQLPPSLTISSAGALEIILKKFSSENISTAIEFRNASWYQAETLSMLAAHKAAVVLHDMKGSEYEILDKQSPFLYVRRHGAGQKYAGTYNDSQLKELTKNIGIFKSEQKESYVFFNNTLGTADQDALRLTSLLSSSPETHN